MAALLGVAAVSTAALAGVQVGPSAPGAQIGQYVETTGGGGGLPTGGGEVAEIGAGGALPFTGVVLLPLLMVGIVLILGAVALRRRANASPVTA